MAIRKTRSDGRKIGESVHIALANLPENCIIRIDRFPLFFFAIRRLRALKYNVEYVFDLYGIYLTLESKYKINYFIN